MPERMETWAFISVGTLWSCRDATLDVGQCR